MKSPKEKAEQLVAAYQNLFQDEWSRSAIDCAVIAVDEILKLKLIDVTDRGYATPLGEGEYWRQVKQELLNMTR